MFNQLSLCKFFRTHWLHILKHVRSQAFQTMNIQAVWSQTEETKQTAKVNCQGWKDFSVCKTAYSARMKTSAEIPSTCAKSKGQMCMPEAPMLVCRGRGNRLILRDLVSLTQRQMSRSVRELPNTIRWNGIKMIDFLPTPPKALG